MSQLAKPDGDQPVIEVEEGLAVRPVAEIDPTRGGGTCWCSRQPKSDKDRIEIMRAMQSAVPKLASVINQPIKVTDVSIQLVTLTNQQTGEVSINKRTVVFCEDGKLYSAVSTGVDKSLGMIFQLFRWPPWKPALPLVLRSQDLPGGKRFHYLEIDSESLKKDGNLK